MSDDHLIGRQTEQAALDRALADTQPGTGGIVLLAGEAGVGKTLLLEACLARSGRLALKGPSNEIATPPYGPIAAALRAYLRPRPDGLAGGGPLTPYLGLLLPELGPAPDSSDPAVLIEAICQAFATIARTQAVVLVLDDLQWADNATLELVPTLVSTLTQEPLLIVATYRNDEIGRGHPLRRLRNDLRRARMLREIVVEPLDPAATTKLAARILGQAPGPALAASLYERTEGVPLQITELTAALAAGGRLRPGEAGIELAPGADLPIPDTLRDAVLLRLDGLPDTALRLLQLAAVAGREFDLAQLAALAGGAEGLDTLLERGLLVEVKQGWGAYRHALTREAIYSDIAWGRRRALHRQMAEHLQAEGAAPLAIAQHWLAAKEPEGARAALLVAAEQACAIHAYRDAAGAAQRALELWPEGADDAGRLDVLDQLGQCAQLCGLLPEAARAWREVADGRRQTGDLPAYAATERRLANVAELQGHWERALAAREAAAETFAVSGMPAEAAIERLAAAAHLRSAGQYRTALALLATARQDAAQAGRPDLQARMLGLEGNVRARMGQVSDGLALVQRGLALALEHNVAGAVAEIYQRLADSLEHAGDYAGARETYLTAFSFCQAHAIPATAQLCVACLTVVLRQTGEWERAMTLCREVLASPDSVGHARAVASCMLGTLYVLRGQPGRAGPLLLEAVALSRQIELAAAELLALWGLALVAEQQGADEKAAEGARGILSRWEQVEDCHYAVPALRWAVSFFARTNADADARACAHALMRIATVAGNPEALSALAHALGEIALLDGDPAQAVQQFRQAVDLLRDVTVPYCLAATQLRAGMACAVADQRGAAVAHLASAYRTARKLGARPLATRIAEALTALGEPVDDRLGPGAARRFRSGDLTRRQREIVQLVSQGQTNAEIARSLTLSPRTVEMHVANILATLDCRSRADAVRRATELGLLDAYGTTAQKIP
ncbi:MAG TPA: AAA family ATPase [Chloroflexia bacterium]|nr:AAA family ATPase [Chloroflexia bacterium]